MSHAQAVVNRSLHDSRKRRESSALLTVGLHSHAGAWERGKIVSQQWQTLPERFAYIEMDAFVVMPNPIHGIIEIVGAPLAGAHSAKND